MKAKHSTLLIIMFVLIFNSLKAQNDNYEREAGYLQETFKYMIENAKAEKWEGTRTCGPEKLINAIPKDQLIPIIKGKETKDPDLLDVINQFKKNRYRGNLKNMQVNLMNKEFKSGNCSYLIQSFIKFVDPMDDLVWCKISTNVRTLECDCGEDSNENDIKSGAFFYEALILGRKSTLAFFLPEDKTQIQEKIKIVRLECCPVKEEDDENPKEDKEADEDKEDKEDHMSNEDNEDCCTTESPKQTIGFLPGAALTDNFKNFSYDVALEYARNFGETFPNNRLYLGGLAGYMSVDSQEGEVKETMVYGALFGENRTPISDCGDVQWVNRLCVLYGSGKIDAFGNEEDFSTLTFGVHTGANFQLSDSFAIGADVTLLNFGSITYKNDNSEFKEDIGDLYVNKGNRVRFGFRFTF